MMFPARFGSPSSSASRFITRVLGGVLLLNLIVFVIAAMSLYQSRSRHEERATTASKNLAVVLEREISATLDKVDLVLLSVADEVARVNAGHGAEAATLDGFITRQSSRLPELHGLRTTDAQGDVNHGYGLVKGVRANLSNRGYYIQLASQPDAGMVISKPVVSRVSGEWEIVLARRLAQPDGSFGGVVYATIALQHFIDKFAALDVGRRGVVALRDTELAIIARHPIMVSIADDVGKTAVSPKLRVPVMAGQTAGTYTGAAGSDSVERTTSFRRVARYPMYVVVGLGTEDYLAEWRTETATAIALVAGFLFLTLLFAALMLRAWRRREAHVEALGMQERKFRTLLESSPDALVIADARHVIAIVNRQAELMFGYAQQELIGQPIEMLLPERYRGVQFAWSPDASDDATELSRERDLWAITKAGREFPVSISLSPIDTEQGGMVAAAIRDMTERRASEEQIEFLAHHDALTGLPNRVVVQSRFEQAIAQADRTGSKVALLFLDLDNFKRINDSLGHQTGDAMLQAVAQRLRECARETDTISRQGGDEFLVVFAELADAEAARAVIERLIQRFQLPCLVDGHEISTPFSLGISLYPDDGRDYGTLLQKADIAMYQAKDAGRNTYRFFNDQMNIEAAEHLHMLNGLRLASERGEFVLHYQPQIDLASGRVVGAEALIRWNHPELGLVPPGRFIPVAEESGLIVPIGDWVLREACRQAVAWQDAGLPSLSIAVNLSAVQFARGNVELMVRGALDATGLQPSLLELELTESILVQNVESVLTTVKRLKLLGVQLSIDDFGTGYSSLSYLKRFAFDKLKIDQSFIRDLATDPENAAIVRAIMQMARGLGLETIAEGVENEPALERLLAFKCDTAQGYLFARPMPAEQFAAYLGAAARRFPSGAWATDYADLAAGVLEMPLEDEASFR